MIISFQVANFRSLRDATRLSMEASSLTDKPGEVEVVRQVKNLPANSHGILPAAILYGANASGKSNVVKALDLLADLVVFPVRFQNDTQLARLFNPARRLNVFRLDEESRGLPVEFEITFLHAGIRYTYALAMTRDKVHAESLSAWSSRRETVLFTRGDAVKEDGWIKAETQKDGMAQTEWVRHSEKQEIAGERWNFGASFAGKETEGKALAGRTRSDMPFLSAASLWDHPQCKAALGWFFTTLDYLDVDSTDRFAVQRSVNVCAKNDEFRKAGIAFLKAADLGIEGLEIETVQHAPKPDGTPADEDTHAGWTLHSDAEGKPVRFDLQQDESYGTLRIFGLVPFILRALNHGRVLVVDELHAGLHPLLLRCLVRLFQSPETNPKGAQLIFATHDATLLDTTLLRRDQIYLTEKDASGATTLYSIADFKDTPKKDAPLMKHYLAGRFEAVPHLAEEKVWAGFARALAGAKEEA